MERHGFIWVWLGDAALADAAAIPDPQRRLLKLNIDAGGVRSRMIIDKLVAAEHAAAAPSPLET